MGQKRKRERCEGNRKGVCERYKERQDNVLRVNVNSVLVLWVTHRMCKILKNSLLACAVL